jgi:hypothetical protein
MKLVKHGVGAVEIFLGPIRVDAAIRLPGLAWNGDPAALGGGSQAKLWRKTDRSDAVSRKAILPADLFALKGMVAFKKILAQGMPLIENHRQVLFRLMQPVAQTHKYQGGGNRTTFESGIANAARHSGAQLYQPFLLCT